MCGQVFLHYNNKATKGWDKNLFDNRPHLDIPIILQIINHDKNVR